MTSGSLFFNLQKEDLKRRLWVFAVLFLVFFFSLPVAFAMHMESAAASQYIAYNHYEAFVNNGTMSMADYQARLLELKTAAALEQVSFHRAEIAFLVTISAVLAGVSSFSYLHNKKMVDFYHSIPVKRECFFGVRYADGLLIFAAAYLINLVCMLAIGAAYGILVPAVFVEVFYMAALHLMYFALLYAVMVTAMLLTGNLLTGILAGAVLYFFLPGLIMVIAGYCDTFFLTRIGSFLGDKELMKLVYNLPPFGVYSKAMNWEEVGILNHAGDVLAVLAEFGAFTALNLWLHRRRPSEAAGKSMAFKRTMMPIRLFLTAGFGLFGGLFFYMLQSRIRWGLFGVAVSVLLVHAIIEIIYHQDFKRLFSHRIQMGLCFVFGVLVFMGFRLDWYGYDSWFPKADQVESMAIEVGRDTGYWCSSLAVPTERNGGWTYLYRDIWENSKDQMRLTDYAAAMALAERGHDYMEEQRADNFAAKENLQYAAVFDSKSAEAVSVIGGADGPTAVFVAGKSEEPAEKERMTEIKVLWRLKGGRTAERCYTLDLNPVMESYRSLYDQPEYKKGLYPVFDIDPKELSKLSYVENETAHAVLDPEKSEEILEAYQQDLLEQTVEDRLQELPVGTLRITTHAIDKVMNVNYWSGYEGINWPVYPSFHRTEALLNTEGIELHKEIPTERIKEIRIGLHKFYQDPETGISYYPTGKEEEELQKINPRYENGDLVITDPEEISLFHKAFLNSEMTEMNGLYEAEVLEDFWVNIELLNGVVAGGQLLRDEVTPEIETLFTGISNGSIIE